ncbi:MAG: hypothetical protein KME04_04195 [Pleurocapsa minor GSE-CHR-MK-17-07R]|jgi:hypothetical protein|nr:hypothetical protein [Pleurocapsa minor GSE-CHR-MK 17-07R]
MNGLQLNDILALLGPGTGDAIWNIFLYTIFVLSLLALFLMPDKNLLATLLVGAILLAVVIAKLSLSARPPLLRNTDFGMFVLNIIPFVFPMLAAGIIRAKKKAKVVIPLVLTALVGAVYFFWFWFTEQSTL